MDYNYRLFKWVDDNLIWVGDYEDDEYKEVSPGNKIVFDDETYEILEVHFPNPKQIKRKDDVYCPDPIAIVKKQEDKEERR